MATLQSSSLVGKVCALPLPSLWTVAALALFAVAVAEAPLFGQDSVRSPASDLGLQ